MSSIVQQCLSLGLCPTFPSPNPHYKLTFGSLTLCQSLSCGRQKRILCILWSMAFPFPNPTIRQQLSHWPCVKSCQMGDRDKYCQHFDFAHQLFSLVIWHSCQTVDLKLNDSSGLHYSKWVDDQHSPLCQVLSGGRQRQIKWTFWLCTPAF